MLAAAPADAFDFAQGKLRPPLHEVFLTADARSLTPDPSYRRTAAG